MRRHVLIRVLLVAAAVGLAALAWTFGGFASDEGAGLSRRHALLGLLLVGVFSLAAYGFDLRDWF